MIITRRVRKVYEGNVTALADVSIAIPTGEFVFLVGPNGAGKTTLIKLVTREESATSGAVLCFGRDVGALQGTSLSEHRRTLGSVFQDPRLVGSKTVRENVLLPVEADGAEEDEAEVQADHALELAQVEDLADRFPDELSGGQRQRVAIARAMVNKPRILLADEPTGNLSPLATEEVMAVFDRINSSGVTVVLATHNLEVVDDFGRRVIALDDGRVAADAQNSRYPDFLRKQAA